MRRLTMAKDMLGGVVRKLTEIPLEMLGAIYDFLEKLSGSETQEWFYEFKKFLRKEKCWVEEIHKQILRLISGNEMIIIDAVDGTEVLSKAKDLFTAGIDSDFVGYGANEAGSATGATIVNVYEMVEDATYVQMFGSLCADMDKLCLTQHQIKNFVKNNRKWLREDGYATLFLFKSKDQFFVARVRVSSGGGLRVLVYRFKNSIVWRAENRHRVVVPQLA
jgi:hypothetical protein